MVLVYVNNMLIIGDSLSLIEETKSTLQHAFKIKDLGELKYFLGIEFVRSKQGILMHQRKYALELILKLGLGISKPSVTPLDTNAKLTTNEYDEHCKSVGYSAVEPLANINSYQRLIGKLLYLTITRPAISFNVQILSQFLQQPKRSHMEASMRIVMYVKNQPGRGILLSSTNKNITTTYYDAEWAACPLSRKLVTGYLIKIGDSLVAWKLKKQITVPGSSAEAEYRSIRAIIADSFGYKDLCKKLELKLT
ncbi:uncharacterized mitochondrial protein AtMg00810-like [Nicotiana tomentosiformis]|uniref:uncharacterized mitochondrial protein AtMg00810-like n=1 Tax=Nicotiana tomentosiformis TaxID=4098 RepID=UPI00388CE813